MHRFGCHDEHSYWTTVINLQKKITGSPGPEGPKGESGEQGEVVSICTVKPFDDNNIVSV